MSNTTSPRSGSTVCFSFAAYARTVIEHLRRCHVPVSKGLSDVEFQRIQTAGGFIFPPDLRSILQEGLPTGLGFPDWRSATPRQLAKLLSMPLDGICSQIANGSFWWRGWGRRPTESIDALRIARDALKRAPILVPIYSYCYIPCYLNISGNPIFFIYQKDIYYYGYDLADFFEREVFVPLHSPSTQHQISSNMNCALESQSGHSGLEALKQGLGSRDLHHQNDIVGLWRGSDQELVTENTKSRKSFSEAPLHELERPSANLVRSAGNSPRSSEKVSIMSRYMYFHSQQQLPRLNVITELTVGAPPWAAKAPRHIPLWSDLVENKQAFRDAGKCVGTCQQKRITPLCLDVYFKDVKGRLRKGGWNQDDIREMIDAAMPDYEWLLQKQTGDEILDALGANAETMSAALRRAGWELQDVLEIFGHGQQLGKLCWRMVPGGESRERGSVHARGKRRAGKLRDFLAQG